MAQVRPAPVAPPRPTAPLLFVSIYHAGYRWHDSVLPLLQFNAVDCSGTDAAVASIDYHVAVVACGIIAGNTWDTGWLALSAPGGGLVRVERPEDGVLRAGDYFYCAQEDADVEYPVLPSFDHWRFPNGQLPYPWSALSIPSFEGDTTQKGKAAASSRDKNCRITGFWNGCEAVHLVPLSTMHWFQSNKMNRYAKYRFDFPPIEDEKNFIFMRRDLHYLFDQKWFAFVPKLATNSAVELVIHVLEVGVKAQLRDLYHNCVLHPISGIAVEYLFARFAWALFSDERITFFTSPLSKFKVQLYNKDRGHSTVEQLSGGKGVKDRAALFGPSSKSRSVSPKKRQLSQNNEDLDRSPAESGTEGSDEEGSDAENRGRSRTRKWKAPKRLCMRSPSASMARGTSSVSSIQTPENVTLYGVGKVANDELGPTVGASYVDD